MTTVINYAAEDGVGVITLARPKVNAYEAEFQEQLHRVVTEADLDANVAVIILRSALPHIFSVGADINVWGSNSVAANQRLVDAARATANALAKSSKISIAEINGHALGGGLELAMSCDLRFASDREYQLGLPEVRLGLMPGNGGTQRLMRLVGISRALELIVSGDGIGPKRALEIGLVNQLFSHDDLVDKTYEYARNLAAGPRRAIAAIKESLVTGSTLPIADSLAIEAALADSLYETPDAAEGFTAFMEKRPPLFGATGEPG